MAVYPAQLTTEEKNLKKRYVRLQEKRKLLRKHSDKSLKDHGMAGPSHSPIKQTPKEVLNPKDAKDAAKKLLMTGKLLIPKQPNRKTGFKRVGELPGQMPPAKKANTGPGKAGTSTVGGGGKQNPPKPKIVASDVKELYSRFVKASKSDDLERIPKRAEAPESSHRDKESESKTFTTKDCTVYVYVDIKVKSLGLTEEALRVAFSRFGAIQSLLTHSNKGSAFLTFDAPSIAATAKKEMSGGMIRGTEVRVDFASEENGYVELTPEAASNPWSVLAAERDTKKSEPKAKSKRPLQVYGTAPF